MKSKEIVIIIYKKKIALCKVILVDHIKQSTNHL